MYLPMAKVPPIVNLSAEDQAQLVRWKSTQGTPQQVALRCRLVLAAAEGYPDLEIASHHGVTRHTVALWRERVQAKGIGSVWEIQAGRGRKPKYELEKRDALIRATLETKPKGMTHWSCRTMAKAQGVSKSTVNRLWQLHNLKPHLSRTFKLSRDQTHHIGQFLDELGIARQLEAAPEPHLHAVARAQGHREIDRCGGSVFEPTAEGDRVVRG